MILKKAMANFYLWIVQWKRFKQGTIVALRPTAVIIMLLINPKEFPEIGHFAPFLRDKLDG